MKNRRRKSLEGRRGENGSGRPPRLPRARARGREMSRLLRPLRQRAPRRTASNASAGGLPMPRRPAPLRLTAFAMAHLPSLLRTYFRRGRYGRDGHDSSSLVGRSPRASAQEGRAQSGPAESPSPRTPRCAAQHLAGVATSALATGAGGTPAEHARKPSARARESSTASSLWPL
jgi:hypothetical protein